MMSYYVLTNIYQFICRWSRFEKEVEKNQEVQARESESKSSETNLVTFQVNDIPEWGTLDKNLNLVQSIDLWFQGRFSPQKMRVRLSNVFHGIFFISRNYREFV